jgi:hypothetical protein
MGRNPGYLLKITGGVHTGKKGLAYHKEQTPEFKQKKKVFVHLISAIWAPELKDGKPHSCLVDAGLCEVEGMVD